MHPNLKAMPSRLQQRLHRALDFVSKVDKARKDLLIVDWESSEKLAPLDLSGKAQAEEAGPVAELMAKSPIRRSPIRKSPSLTGSIQHMKSSKSFRETNKSLKKAPTQKIFDSQLLPRHGYVSRSTLCFGSWI